MPKASGVTEKMTSIPHQPLGLFPRRTAFPAAFALVFLCLFGLSAAWAGPAVTAHVKGQVERKLPDSADWNSVEIGDRLPEGTEIRTGEKSEADLDLDQGHHLHIISNTVLILSA